MPQHQSASAISNLLEEAENSIIHEKDEIGNNALHVAAFSNQHAEVCELLLDRGAEIKATGYLARTALHCAAANSTPEVMKVLFKKGANLVLARDDEGCSPLHLSACYNPNPAVTQLLLGAGAHLEAANHNGRTALHNAAARNSREVVQVLLDRGANTAARNALGCIPLHFSAELSTRPEVVALLLANGTKPQAVDHFGYMPLHRAAKFNASEEVLKTLMEKTD